MLIGLTAKNAILIMELAKAELEKGKSVVAAALEGARLRLRPILMTSFAFVLGCVPLWIASGAGAAARRVMGTVVVSGMLAATLLGIFFPYRRSSALGAFPSQRSNTRAPVRHHRALPQSRSACFPGVARNMLELSSC